MKVRRKIRAPLDVSHGIDVNGSNARLARLVDLTAEVARNLLEIIIGVGDHAATQTLEREKLSLIGAWAESDYVFTTTVGTPIDPHNLLVQFKMFLRRAGLPGSVLAQR